MTQRPPADATETIVLYSGPDLDVLFRPAASDYAVVTFSPSNWYAGEREFWGLPLARVNAIAMIGVVAKRGNWFPASGMEAALPAMRDALKSFSAVVSYGASMGGYGALRYSAELGATCCLSFVPQISIAPNDVGDYDKRFLSEYTPRHHDGMLIREQHICRNSFVFYDPELTVDRLHFEEMQRAAPRIKGIRCAEPDIRPSNCSRDRARRCNCLKSGCVPTLAR